MWSHSFTKHLGGPQGLWAGPGLLRSNGYGLGSQSSQHRGRLNKLFRTGELSTQSSEEGLVTSSYKNEHLKSCPDDEFLLKSRWPMWSPSVIFLFVVFSHKLEACQGCELFPLIGVGDCEVGIMSPSLSWTIHSMNCPACP